MLDPRLMSGQSGSADERRLLRLYRALDAESRRTLLALADFLAHRARDPSAGEGVPGDPHAAVPTLAPTPEPRPADESVVAAIKRLRRSYPMLDSGTMLHETSALMAAHVLQGREAAAVIDELEALFAARYEAFRGASD
jgi:hypothetical protein